MPVNNRNELILGSINEIVDYHNKDLIPNQTGRFVKTIKQQKYTEYENSVKEGTVYVATQYGAKKAKETEKTSSYETINNINEVNSKLKGYYDNYNLSSIKYEDILNSELENKMDLYNIKYSYENTYESNQNLMQLLTLNNQAISDSLNTLNASSTKINGMITMLKGYLLETEKGANDLNGGLTELKQGMIFYDTKMGEVNTGLIDLNNGMSTLNDGIIEFNKEGISTITNYMNKLSNLTDKIEVLTDYSNSYKTISITNNEIKGTTKFVNVIEEVKVQETKIDNTNNSTKLSFIDRVKNLFK